MAEKGFGVKEVNLIGASGTPTITSPNNLNLNANNVAISTNVSIGGTLTVTGNVSVGGTLTYEDVTNIDSVGIVTAREGIKIPDDKKLQIGNNQDIEIYHTSNESFIRNKHEGNYFNFQSGVGASGGFIFKNEDNDETYAILKKLGVELYYNDTKRLETSNTGATVTGTLTATTFSGSGASLTSLPAANLTGTLPAISGANLTNLPADTPTNSDIQVAYTVTANGSSAYRFAGNGVVSTADNPDLYFIRGQKYRFINNSGGSHPFQIRESSGGSAYSTGVTNNGAASGNIDFAPTYDSPAQLVYQCTSHGGMVGNIYLRDAAGGNTNVGVTTFSGGITVSGNTSFAGGNVTMTASGSPNSLNVSGTSRFEIASIENAEIDGEIAHSGDTDTKISFDTNTIKFNTAGSERLRITSGGSIKVGFINNVNPTTVFDVMANAINQDIVRFTGANYNRGLKISTAASGAVSDALIKYDADSQNSAGQHAFLTDGTERLRITTSGKIGIGEDDPESNHVLIRGSSTVATKSGHIMLTGDSATVGEGPQIVFSESGGGSSYAGGYVGFIRRGSNSIGDLVFGTRGTSGDANTVPTERLRITSDGKIGVNATTTALIAPTYTLDLGGNDGVLDTSEQNTLRIRCNNGGTAIRVGSGGGSSQVVLIRVDGHSIGNNCLGETDSSSYGASITYRGDRAGNENSLGIYMDNTTNASQVEALNLRQNGDYIFGGSSYSDRDQKENITSLPGTALDKITQLTPRTWNWKPEYHDIPTDRIFGGFIAQEVLPHIPSIVKGTDGQGDMSLDYQGLLAWTIKALTELKSENDNLKARVNTLESS